MSRPSLLLIDDDCQARTRIARLLIADGFRVFEAGCADEGVLQARRLKPALALLGLSLEGQPGRDLADYLCQVVRVPFIAVCADPLSVAAAERAGALASVGHDAGPETIQRVIGSALRRTGRAVSPAV